MLKSILLALPLIGKLIDWLTGRQRAAASEQDIQAGENAAAAKTEGSSLDAISRANAAAVDQSLRDLTGLRTDDGFKRPGGTGPGQKA